MSSLPILPNKKDFRQNMTKYKQKLEINKNKLRQYSKCIDEEQKGMSYISAVSNSVSESDQYQPPASQVGGTDRCVLVIEVIKAWSSVNARVTNKTLPVLEIQKLNEFGNGRSEHHLVDNNKSTINKNVVVWSQVFELKFNESVSDVHKKFKISLFQKNKGRQNVNVQIGQTYTISVLTTLDSQTMTFRTFDFSNGREEAEWSVATRMQYIYDRPTLYKTIINRLEERNGLLEKLIEKVRLQKNRKLGKDTNIDKFESRKGKRSTNGSN